MEVFAPTIQIESGNDQAAEVGAGLALPFVVVVNDRNNAPIADVTVTFAVQTGGGSLTATTATTDASGHAQSTLTLGATAGMNTITASADGVTGTVVFLATGTTPAAVMFSTHVKPILDAQCISCHKEGGSAQFTPLTTYALVRFGTSTSAGHLVVAGSPTTSMLVQKLQPIASMYGSLGTDAATRDANARTISNWIAEGALNTAIGPAAQLALISGNNQSATVAGALPTPFVVRATDENDNPISGATVAFAVSSGGGTLSASTATTDALGQAKTTLTVGAAAGANTVTASATGVMSPVTFNATATAGTATQIALVSGNNGSAIAGSTLTAPFVVGVRDGGGNPVAGFSVTFTVATGGGSLSVATILTNASGQAQTRLTLGTTAGTNTVTANATGLTGSPVTFTATGTAGTATKIALESGNNQSATVGAALSAPLVVAVTDVNGNPVSGVAVSFAVASGGGSLSATSVTTNALGRAQTALTVGATAGANTVTATRAGLTGSPITFTANGTTGTATQFALVSGNNGTASVGTAVSPFVVAVKDGNGNPIVGFSVTFAVTAGGGTLSTPTAMTNASGQAQTTLTLGTAAGTNTVTANATGLTGSPITFTATGTAGAATQLALVSGNNQTASVGTALPMPFVVAVKDANGNPKPGVAVTFAITSGGGSISATTVTTNSVGQAQTTLTLGATVGTKTVTASATGLTSVTFTATATTGTASQIALVSGNTQSALAGTTLLNPFNVVVKDANGNPVGGFSVSFSVTSGGGTLSAASMVTNAQGLAQTTLTLGSTAGTNTVTANATGLTGAPVTFTATGTTGAATQISLVSGNNQTGRVGAALAIPLVVAVKDANANPVSGVIVTFAVTSGGGSLSATSVTTNSAGQAQTALTVGATPGTNTVTATRVGLTGSPITFTATARKLTYEDDVQPILVASCVSCHMPGGQASFTPLTTYTQVRFGMSFSSSAPLVVPNSPATSLLVGKTQAGGSMYVQLGPDVATRNANAKTISDWVAQGAFNSSVGAASQIVSTSGNNQSGSVSTNLTNPFVVTVMDAALNPVSGYTVSFAVVSGGGSLSTTSVVTTAQGTAGSLLKLGANAGTNTATATGAGLTNSPITFTATATAGSYAGAPLAGSTNPFDVAGLIALKAANIEPVPLSSDGEFLRRATADLAGRLPTLDEWTAFAASPDPAKRDLAIDRLLASSEFATHWGVDILAAWLAVDRRDSDDATAVTNFEAYLVDAAATDKPLATVVTELAQGTGTGGAAFDVFNMVKYDRHMAADRLLETFTGIPTKCARCHDSKITGPLDDPKWTTAQNRGLYKFFEVDAGEFSYYDPTLARYVNPPMMFVVDGVSTNPANLPAPTDTLAVRRARFGQLLAASNAFKRGTGHRLFAEVMEPLLNSNRILAQAIADVKVPEVLKASTAVFSNGGTSLKGYLRTLLRSKLYQLTTTGTTTANDRLLGRRVLRRHNAETIQAGIVAVTGVVDSAGTRTDFLSKFGYPMDRAEITERSYAINTIQPLTLLNNTSSVPGKVTTTAGIVAGLATKVDASTMTLDAAISEIFRRALTRDPTAAELSALKSELATAATTKEKLEDVAAVVMASIEFASR